MSTPVPLFVAPLQFHYRARMSGSSGALCGAVNSKATLFDTVPDGVVENILRCMSEYPSLRYWRFHMGPKFISRTSGLGGPWGGALESLGNTLALWVRPTEPTSWESLDDIWAVASGKSFVAYGNECVFKSLTAYGGSFTFITTSAISFCPGILAALREECPNIHGLELRLAAQLPEWIGSFGRQLRFLKVTQPFCACCTADIWEVLGETLEVLSIKLHPTLAESEMKKMEKFCRKLRWIDLGLQACPGGKFYAFLASYGTQLEYATLPVCDCEHLGAMVNACPYARFNADQGDTTTMNITISSTGFLRALKLQLVDVTLANSEEYPHSEPRETWRSAWGTCAALEKFTGIDFKECCLCDVMSTPKRRLKHLFLKTLYPITKKTMDLIANNTGGLVSLGVELHQIPGDTFDKLVEKNPALSTVRVRVTRDDPNNDSDTEVLRLKLVSCFLKPPNLSFLDVRVTGDDDAYRPAIADICVPHRNRQVFVMCAGYVYLR